MKAHFELDEHYRHKVFMGRAELTHTHWLNNNGELTSLLNVKVRALDSANRSINAEIDIWDASPAELRLLAAAMNEAADSLAAHAAQAGIEVAA